MARSKSYEKTHKNKKALFSHKKNIEKRGGSVTIFGATLDYSFPANKKKRKARKKK